MNYRHAFHAGNAGDCMKHALLVWLTRALLQKPAPFCVLDAYAGAGRYDLAAAAALRTGEWSQGIGRMLENPPAALADYVGLVTRLGLYPGSPELVRALLRPEDRLICCELHPEDHATLQRLFAGDRQVAVHFRDAREAVGALLPPKKPFFSRGLVLLDPPYEDPGEFAAVVAALSTAGRKFPTGVACAWYPIKHRAPVRAFHLALQTAGLRDVVAAELWLRDPLDPTRLNGCGLVVVNPPYRFEDEVPAILDALRERLAEPDGGSAILRLADE